MARNQRTISGIREYSGICAHSGEIANLSIRPAPEDTGVVFVRSDLSANNEILATYKNTVASPLCTQIVNEYGVEVRTIEHLMATLYALQVDNVYVYLDSPEMPIFDGSAQEIVKLIGDTVEQNIAKKSIKINHIIECEEDGKKVKISPNDDGLILEVECDFTQRGLGNGKYFYNHSRQNFEGELSHSRTFGFYEDAEKLRKIGLAKGSSLENTVIFQAGKCINESGLRSPNEHITHKVLDALGDLSVCGYDIYGKFDGYCPGHSINGKLVKKIFESEENYEIIG